MGPVSRLVAYSSTCVVNLKDRVESVYRVGEGTRAESKAACCVPEVVTGRVETAAKPGRGWSVGLGKSAVERDVTYQHGTEAS